MESEIVTGVALFFYFLIGCWIAYSFYKNHKEMNAINKGLMEADIRVVQSLTAISIAIFREIAKRKTNQRADKSTNN